MKVSNLTYLKIFAVILEMVGSCLQVVEYGVDWKGEEIPLGGEGSIPSFTILFFSIYSL